MWCSRSCAMKGRRPWLWCRIQPHVPRMPRITPTTNAMTTVKTASVFALDDRGGATGAGSLTDTIDVSCHRNLHGVVRGERIDGRRIRARSLDECDADATDRKSTRLNSSHMSISYAVFCLKKKKKKTNTK